MIARYGFIPATIAYAAVLALCIGFLMAALMYEIVARAIWHIVGVGTMGHTLFGWLLR